MTTSSLSYISGFKSMMRVNLIIRYDNYFIACLFKHDSYIFVIKRYNNIFIRIIISQSFSWITICMFYFFSLFLKHNKCLMTMRIVSDLIPRLSASLTYFCSLLSLEKLSTRCDFGMKPGPTQNSDSNISETMHPVL